MKKFEAALSLLFRWQQQAENNQHDKTLLEETVYFLFHQDALDRQGLPYDFVSKKVKEGEKRLAASKAAFKMPASCNGGGCPIASLCTVSRYNSVGCQNRLLEFYTGVRNV